MVIVVLMTASQFFTQLQIISKNLSPETKASPTYQLQRILLYILPFGLPLLGLLLPARRHLLLVLTNIWTMGQQFLVIREMPTPGSDAAKAREERLARKGKAIDSSGKVVPMEKYQAEQQRLVRRGRAPKAATPSASSRSTSSERRSSPRRAAGRRPVRSRRQDRSGTRRGASLTRASRRP